MRNFKKTPIVYSLLSLAVIAILGYAPWAHFSKKMGSNAARDIASTTPNRCLAIRGNGELIMSHFSSLAAITEHFGLFDGLAGGSSASLSMFVYESIRLNPAIQNCKDANGSACTPAEVALRASLLLKSVYAYIDLVQNSQSGQAALQFYQDVSVLQAQFKASPVSQVASLSSIDPGKLAQLQGQFQALTQNPTANAFINPRTFGIMIGGLGDDTLGLKALTQTPSDLAIHLHRMQDYYNAVQTFGSFSADTKQIFFRPSLVSFDQLALNIGLIANFYAGRGNSADNHDYDQAGLNSFINNCANASKNLNWYDFTQASPQCKQQITTLIQNYNENHSNQTVAEPRVHDKVGQFLHILASSAVIPVAAEAYKAVARNYLNGIGNGYSFKPTDFQVFNQIQFGYFGNSADIDHLTSNAQTSAFKGDYKMQRVHGFKDATWEEVINYSPAEPGLSALTIPSQLNSLPNSPWKNKSLPMVANPNDVMAAGWSDLTPTFALRNMGCQEVLYITRREPESSFAQGLIAQLGATQTQVNALYSLNPAQNPPSSFENALKAADGVWCTDWNAADLEIPHAQALDHDAYNETHLETDSASTVYSMLIDPNDPIRSRVTAHQYEGCGGQTQVVPGHLHAN